ncbi:hypothetical protein, partial [Ralstonia solanacearum]|uniref:hypothetical protein n=1 Tax=Ralstonia solanacearum TaxID=305 RepID=UPI001C869967
MPADERVNAVLARLLHCIASNSAGQVEPPASRSDIQHNGTTRGSNHPMQLKRCFKPAALAVAAGLTMG